MRTCLAAIPGMNESEVRFMFLMYVLFALTVAVILTALFAARAPERRSDEIFMGSFVLLLATAWAAGEWIAPALSGKPVSYWLPLALVGIFVAILAVSASLAVRPPDTPVWAAVHHNKRQDAEAAAFDIVLWLLMLLFGIASIRSMVP